MNKEVSGRRCVQLEVVVQVQSECARPRAQQLPGTPEGVWHGRIVMPLYRGAALYLRSLLTGVALLILLPSARAQETGKEHDHLAQLVGTWDAESEFGKGTMTYKMGLGGQWLIGDYEGEFGGMKFEGKGLDTYDSATKKYRSVWVDSFTTGPRIMEGNLDNKVMTMTGEGPGHEGKTGKFKSITEFKDADTMNFTLFMVDKDGKELPTVKITYKRKK